MTNVAQDLLIPSSFKDKPLNDKEVIAWNNQAQAFLKLYGKQHVKDQGSAGIASIAQLSDEEPWLSEDTMKLARGMFTYASFLNLNWTYDHETRHSRRSRSNARPSDHAARRPRQAHPSSQPASTPKPHHRSSNVPNRRRHPRIRRLPPRTDVEGAPGVSEPRVLVYSKGFCEC